MLTFQWPNISQKALIRVGIINSYADMSSMDHDVKSRIEIVISYGKLYTYVMICILCVLHLKMPLNAIDYEKKVPTVIFFLCVSVCFRYFCPLWIQCKRHVIVYMKNANQIELKDEKMSNLNKFVKAQ